MTLTQILLWSLAAVLGLLWWSRRRSNRRTPRP